MKIFLKKIARFLIVLNQESEKDMRQSILLVDGSFILPNNFTLIIKNVREKFKNANLTVLTFSDKEKLIRDNFPDVKIIVPENGLKLKNHQFAIQLLLLLRRNFNFVILSSLDISIIFISTNFARCPIFLHNRWMEWYRIRLRTLADVLHGVRSMDRRRQKKNKGMKDTIKSIGRIFIILVNIDIKDSRCPILVVDNGYTDIGHVSTAVRKTMKAFVNAEISILTFPHRAQCFVDMFPELAVIPVKEASGRYGLAIKMLRMWRLGFKRVVLTTLDISPIVISLLFMRTNVLLYNKWHQWWRLSFRNISGYFKGAAKLLIIIPVFTYLLIAALYILLKTGFRLCLNSFNKERK